MEEEQPTPKNRLKQWSEWFGSMLDMVMDEYMGCIAAIGLSIVGTIVIGLIVFLLYSSFAHMNQHCVLAYQETVIVGHTPTIENVCQRWENN